MVKRTERGWAGHFCCAHDCLFRRNTLLEYKDIKLVVSTVGNMLDPLRKRDKYEIGVNRYYETMVFHADPVDIKYHDADVSKEVHFDSPWSISEWDADDQANLMHEMVVEELIDKLERGVEL